MSPSKQLCASEFNAESSPGTTGVGSGNRLASSTATTIAPTATTATTVAVIRFRLDFGGGEELPAQPPFG